MRRTNLVPLLFLATFILGCSKKTPIKKQPEQGYDEIVLKDNPVGYWLQNKTQLNDISDAQHHGVWKGEEGSIQKLPNGEEAPYFNGVNAYYEIPDADHLEVTDKGVITIEAWMSPSVLDFPTLDPPDKDYIHWMGKGTANQHSWVARMYNKNSFRENRPQRISGYAFNLTGGLGAGSYFQDVISVGTWIHFVLVINTNQTSTNYPTGYTKVYRDGKLRDQDSLSDYSIVPGNGTAPTRIGTRDLNSFFKGSIAKVAIYNYELTAQQIDAHYKAMK